MARKRTQSIAVYRPPVARAAAPIIRIASPRAPATHRKKKGHRRRSSGGAFGGGGKNRVLKAAMGGAAFGFIEKSFPNLPTLPMLGRAGTIALGTYFAGGKSGSGIMSDICFAASVIAGYQLGHDGKIAGDDGMMGDLEGED
jgi:hypothetical protein